MAKFLTIQKENEVQKLKSFFSLFFALAAMTTSCDTRLRYKAVPAEPVDFRDMCQETTTGGESECAEACYMKLPNCSTAMFYPQSGLCRFSDQRYPCDTPTPVEGPSFFRMGFMMLHCFFCHAPFHLSPYESSLEEFAQLLRNGTQDGNGNLSEKQRKNSSGELAEEFDFPPFVIAQGVHATKAAAGLYESPPDHYFPRSAQAQPRADAIPEPTDVRDTLSRHGVGNTRPIITGKQLESADNVATWNRVDQTLASTVDAEKTVDDRSDRPRFIFGSQIDLIKILPNVNASFSKDGGVLFQPLEEEIPGSLNLDPVPRRQALPKARLPSSRSDGLPKMIKEILPALRDAIEDVLMSRGYVFVRAVVEGPVPDNAGQPSVLATFAAPRDFPLAAMIREEPIPVIQFPKLEISSEEETSLRMKTPPVAVATVPEAETWTRNEVAIVPSRRSGLPPRSIPPGVSDHVPKMLTASPIEDSHSTVSIAVATDRPIVTEDYNESRYVEVSTTIDLSTPSATLSTVNGATTEDSQSATLAARTSPDDLPFESANQVPENLPIFRALSAPPPGATLSISNLINETSLESQEIRRLVIGPPDPPQMAPIIRQEVTECPASLMLPCSYGVGRGCQLTVTRDGCRVCRCPFRSPARGCFGSIFMSEQVRQGLLYQERACDARDRKAQSVVRWYRKVTSNHHMDECVAVQYPYCDSEEDRVHRMPRTREECEFFCYGADVELVRQLHFHRKHRL